MIEKYESLSGDRLALRLANAELRMELIAAGKWPAPRGWAFTAKDLASVVSEGADGEIAERLGAALARQKGSEPH
jgi:hypothetical protein